MNNYKNHPLTGATDLDSAMTMLWSFYKRYFLGLYLISVVLSILSSLFTAGIDINAMQSVTDPEEMLELLKGMAGPYVLVVLVSLLTGVFLHTWVLEKPEGDPSFVSSLFKMSLTALIPYLAVMIIFSVIGVVLITIGLVLLILPALFALFYICTVMLFAMPVTLTETRNPMTVVSRSFSLAHRNLWPNMGWVTVIMLILVIISLVIGALTLLPFTGSFINSLTNPEEASSMLELAKSPVYIGITALTTSLVTPVLPILAFILYFRNRDDEESVTKDSETDSSVKVEDLYPKMPEDN
jgi:hypothetical protein